MNALLDNLVGERERLVNLCRNVQDTAAESSRDLSEQDREVLTKSRERITVIDGQLSLVADDFAMSESVQDRLARLDPDRIAPATHSYRSAGELLWDMLHVGTDRDAAGRYSRMMKRAAQHMGTDAAATTPTAGGMPGLLVDPVVGPVIDVAPQGRPFLTAVGVRPAPDALSFRRPRIVDPNLNTGVAPQTLEKAELVSQKFDVLADTLNLTTVGGYLNISQQLIAFVSSSLDVIVSQMNLRLAHATENAAVAEVLETASHVPLSATATGPEILAAIYDASELVYEQTGSMATTIAMGPKGWARLGSLVDAAGRPLFPYLGASNALGTMSAADLAVSSVAGLRPVVTYAITDDEFIVFNSYGLEFYEYRYPVLEAVEPSLLGRQLAVAASVVAYRPITASGAGDGAVTVGVAGP